MVSCVHRKKPKHVVRLTDGKHRLLAGLVCRCGRWGLIFERQPSCC